MLKIEEIRNYVDLGDFDYLAKVKDVHNLTGALKLFFLELKAEFLSFSNQTRDSEIAEK